MAAIEEIGDNVKKIRPSKASSFMIDDILSNQAKQLSAGKFLPFLFLIFQFLLFGHSSFDQISEIFWAIFRFKIKF